MQHSDKDISTNLCTFYIVRHGETEGNVQKIIQGHLDSPLTPYGVELAVSRAKDFRNIEFAQVFASDLLRAQTTAGILAKEKKLAVKTTQLLRERHFGKYEGYSFDKYQEELQEQLDKYHRMLGLERWNHRLANEVESDQEVYERFMRFVRETAVAYPGKNILVVSHGSLIRHILKRVYLSDKPKEDIGHINNLGYFVMETDGVELRVTTLEGIEIERKDKSKMI